MATADHDPGAILGQLSNGNKPDEITSFEDLMNAVKNLVDMTLTADVLHTQSSRAMDPIKGGDQYVLTLNGNQRSL